MFSGSTGVTRMRIAILAGSVSSMVSSMSFALPAFDVAASRVDYQYSQQHKSIAKKNLIHQQKAIQQRRKELTKRHNEQMMLKARKASRQRGRS